MVEYIEREALRAKAVYMHGFGENKYVPLKAIENAPAADVVPVVRCKDCKYRSYDYDCVGNHLCEKRGNRYYCEDNDFCSYGERRDSNG